MPSFKQKNVIKSYKLRLQEKLKAVTEETDNSIAFLNNCLLEFRNRVQHILEIKDEKCLSLYRKLIGDLESYSEKLFILQASLEASDDESDTSDNDETKPKSPKKSNTVPCSTSDIPSHKLSVSSESSRSGWEGPSEDASSSSMKTKSESKDDSETVSLLDKQGTSVTDNFGEDASYPGVGKSEPDDYCAIISTEKSVKTKLEDFYEGAGSTTEDDFCSLHSDSIAQNIASAALLLNSESNRYHSKSNIDKYESNQSVSQSSCYRSFSSNISESLLLVNETVKSTQSSKTQSALTESESNLEPESILVIRPPDIEISSRFFATLVHIVDPGDFWIQIENSDGANIRFSKAEHNHLESLSSIREGNYCLAPLRSSPFFYRGQSLSNAISEKEKVKVHLIDHGSTQEIPLHDLRSLPSSAYDIPAQALHCCLYGVAPVNGIWSQECIEKFKAFRDFHSIETVIKSKDKLYAVQLSANSSENFHQDLSVDVAWFLCLEGLAISENESVSLSMDLNHSFESQASKPASASINSIEASEMTAISNDSGVSVTSAYRSNQNSATVKRVSDEIDRVPRQNFHQISAITVNSSTGSCDKKYGFSLDSQAQDLISFESYDTLALKNSNENSNFTNSYSKALCLTCRRGNFCLHLKIPPPDLVFVEKDMMIVMLSHIVTPHEFYVNLAMEDIVNLDELREQMTSVYESQRKDFPPVKVEDLHESMFCAGYYDEDGYWYRVQIVGMSSKNKDKGLVTVQYVDYGNKATIECSNLQPLNLQFSQHPVFAIKCSLAGIIPIEDNVAFAKSAYSPVWDEDAISTFKQITSFDRCLTAQICNELHGENSDALPVLLWDTEESDDRLLNLVLADLGMAQFDKKLSPIMPLKESTPNPSKEVPKPLNDADALSSWDPMSEEYHDIENSYGVNDEDIQVLTTGYQAKDEEYTCKYYSLRGFCPRGAGCPYEHLPLLESGVTRDQEEVYCLDMLPIIPDTTVNTIVNVSAIINPSHFYIILPYGCKTVDEINSLINSGSTEEEILNSDARALFYAMNKYYNNAPFQENTTVALSCGTIVAARRDWDLQWHRGRVIDESDVGGPAKIFFVDSGDSEWVPRKFIRTILCQFLYTPFQAVQCSLNGVAPIGSKDAHWHSDAVKLFKKAVEGEPLLAENIKRFGQVFHLSLRKTKQGNHQFIGQLLVSAGLAQFCSDIPSVKSSRFVPG